MGISAEQVKKLRDQTGAGMMECKAALQEAEGDLEMAVLVLRKKGHASAAKKAARLASEGVVSSYLHAGGKLGVMVELNCETDFVANTPEFQDLAKDIAMHIAAMNPRYIRREDVPPVILEQEKEIYRSKAQEAGKPEKVIEKIVEGQLAKFYSDFCLYEQPFVKDEKVTVEQLISERIFKIKENISLRRFVRFKVGEGLDRQDDNQLR